MSQLTNTTNWLAEVEKRKEALIADTQALLKIKSILDPETVTETAPFGQGVEQALDFMLTKASTDGFSVKNTEGYAGHIEYGEGKEILGVLGHIDVVPEGSGWNSDPFAAEIRDGRIYARGAIDDKGPVMAAYYGLKMIKELGLPVNKRIRLILGGDEESEWRCVDHYFKTEEMPTIGFSPDAEFPICNAEKGICNLELTYQGQANPDTDFKIISFGAGERLNMVPDLATAVVEMDPNRITKIKEVFKAFCTSALIEHSIEIDNNQVTFTIHGVSAHGSTPHLGVNAGVKLAAFLANYTSHPYFHFIKKYIVFNEDGSKFDIAYHDHITEDLTINYGTFQFSTTAPSIIGLNLRYPVTFDFETGFTNLKVIATLNGFELKEGRHQKPHHVPADNTLVTTLQKVYQEHTGQDATLYSMGGGTYARALTQGVAFGPLFPGREDVVHQKNEYISIDDLIKATAIYAHAIYELAK